jgi:hypothetical protein
MRQTGRIRRMMTMLVATFALVVAWGAVAAARPTYFQVFTERYGIGPADRLYACGVCHYLWTGTGARNPFGNAVEQQLYVGKSITQALQDVEAADSDGDGFSNLDEIMNFMTLPGYSCTNLTDAIGAPLGYDTYITPMVASCLSPIDIRVAPTSLSVIVDANESSTATVTIFNNGSQFPINVSAYGLQPGTNPAFSLTGPVAPIQIPVASSVALHVTFAPMADVLATGTLRILSDDPDEGTIDVPLSGIGVARTLAPAPQRAACLRTIDTVIRRYGKTHLKEWGRCFSDEAAGVACDAGARDFKIAKAAARLHTKIGGSGDRLCNGQGLTPFLLGYPTTCGGSCGSITLPTMSALADCLECRQEETTRTALTASDGTTLPDLPTAVGALPAACERKLVSQLANSIESIQKVLGHCELGNVTAPAPVLCAATTAAAVAALQARVDAQPGRCTDTTGLSSCPFVPAADPACLGTTALTLGSALVDATVPQ